MRIYSYYCCDGYVRTRCRDHIQRTGPYRPISRKAFFNVREGTYTNCVECAWEYFTGQRRAPAAQEVDVGAGVPADA